jgi:hypothetical protein
MLSPWSQELLTVASMLFLPVFFPDLVRSAAMKVDHKFNDSTQVHSLFMLKMRKRSLALLHSSELDIWCVSGEYHFINNISQAGSS